MTSEFQRVQGITRAQAEEYVHKSEGLLKEAQEFLKEAVKVVPPEEADRRGGSVAPAGMLWDGSDLWMIPDVAGPSLKGKEKEGEPSVKSAAEGLRAVATRAESLLKQLRHNPEVIKVDPTADESAKALYEQWTRDHVDSEEGGITGKHWSEATQKALADPADGSALQDTHDALGNQLLNLYCATYADFLLQCPNTSPARRSGHDISSAFIKLNKMSREGRHSFKVCPPATRLGSPRSETYGFIT